jgi:hypothetical protein
MGGNEPVSNTRKAKQPGTPIVTGDGGSVYKWQLRIRSEEPTVVDFREAHFGTKAPMGELYKLIRRTSYQVEGPNREVWWALDIWKNDQWECIIDGKSKLREGSAAS